MFGPPWGYLGILHAIAPTRTNKHIRVFAAFRRGWFSARCESVRSIPFPTAPHSVPRVRSAHLARSGRASSPPAGCSPATQRRCATGGFRQTPSPGLPQVLERPLPRLHPGPPDDPMGLGSQVRVTVAIPRDAVGRPRLGLFEGGHQLRPQLPKRGYRPARLAMVGGLGSVNHNPAPFPVHVRPRRPQALGRRTKPAAIHRQGRRPAPSANRPGSRSTAGNRCPGPMIPARRTRCTIRASAEWRTP